MSAHRHERRSQGLLPEFRFRRNAQLKPYPFRALLCYNKKLKISDYKHRQPMENPPRCAKAGISLGVARSRNPETQKTKRQYGGCNQTPRRGHRTSGDGEPAGHRRPQTAFRCSKPGIHCLPGSPTIEVEVHRHRWRVFQDLDRQSLSDRFDLGYLFRLDTFAAAEQSADSAIGEATNGFFDIDIGL
jgi:hypothetical protein